MFKCLKLPETCEPPFSTSLLALEAVPGAIGSFSTQLKTAMVDVECLKLTETHVDAIFQPT